MALWGYAVHIRSRHGGTVCCRIQSKGGIPVRCFVRHLPFLVPAEEATVRWVAPQMLTTRVPTSEARCILALSIEIIVSKWLIKTSSSFSPCSTSEAQVQPLYFAAHVLGICFSSFPPPKRIFGDCCIRWSTFNTSSIFSFWIHLSAVGSKGATPIQRSPSGFSPYYIRGAATADCHRFAE